MASLLWTIHGDDGTTTAGVVASTAASLDEAREDDEALAAKADDGTAQAAMTKKMQLHLRTSVAIDKNFMVLGY